MFSSNYLILVMFLIVFFVSFVRLQHQEGCKTNWRQGRIKNYLTICNCWSSIRHRHTKSITHHFFHQSALSHFEQKLSKHQIWILPLHLSRALIFCKSYCLTMLWCGQKDSCTSNIWISVNFTLCCLPKNPGPRFCDLAS